MYKIVEAVNQQIPFSVDSSQMLILTKFAELLPQSPKTAKSFRFRVGRERFMAMTHIKKDALKDNLKKLDEKGYLRCLEDRAEKRIGDRPTLYELCLPEGYDADIVIKNLHHRYGGTDFQPTYNEDNREFYAQDETHPRTLTPFSVQDAENSAVEEENSADEEENSAVYVGKNRPINSTRVEENNNAVLSVVNEAAVLTRAPAKKFSACGLTVDTLALMREAMDIYRTRDRSGKHPNQNAQYLCGIFRNLVANKPCGPVQDNPNAPTSANKARAAIDTGWQTLVDGMEIAEMLKPDDKASFEAALRNHTPERVPTFVDNFVKRLLRENGGDFESMRRASPDAKARHAILVNAIEAEATK